MQIEFDWPAGLEWRLEEQIQDHGRIKPIKLHKRNKPFVDKQEGQFLMAYYKKQHTLSSLSYRYKCFKAWNYPWAF